ncbi:MAG: MAPEG family protein [Rhizobiaceae bacterium]|nr:MAPEG family protein [Rhizobiaceae bacterium]
MEFITSLWTAAPVLKTQLVVLAILLQVVITIWCYTMMSGARVKGAKSGTVSPDIYKAVGDAEPEEIRVYTRLVANQFESPVLFYAMVITGLAVGVTSWITVVLALIYILFRYLHAKEMAGEHNVLKRRKIFIRSFQVLLVMALELAISTMFMLGA